jgi:hypothetical protein
VLGVLVGGAQEEEALLQPVVGHKYRGSHHPLGQGCDPCR